MFQLLCLLALASSLVCSVQSHWVPPRREIGRKYNPSKVLYFLENDPSGAKVAAVEIAHNGSLGQVTETSTGGKGLQGVSETDGTPLAPDSLIGQGAVASGDGYIFTVNAGSNTVAMLKIDPIDPLKLTLVGLPVDSMGEFPTSVTYSSKLKTACVINGGAKNGIACFSVSQSGLRPLDSAARSISPALQQTTPPKGPDNTVSQVSFSPNHDYVIATVKGIAPTRLATIFVWKVEDGIVCGDATTTQIPDLYNAFGFSFVGSNDKIFVSSVNYGGSFLALDPSSYQLRQTSNITVPGQAASCWSAYCPELDTAIAVSAGAPLMGLADASTEKLIGALRYDADLMGGLDNVVHGTTMFFLTGTADIGMVDLKEQKLIGEYNLTGRVGSRAYWQGLAM